MEPEIAAYRIKYMKRGLPVGSWGRMRGCGDLAWEGEVRCAEGSGLWCKVLVFRRMVDLIDFGCGFRYAGGSGPCEGCVFDCALMDGGEMWCDRRYACVLCMVEGYVSWGLLAHEAVHVAWSYGVRTRFRRKWAGVKDSWDEHIAYPVGWLVEAVGSKLRGCGFL